MFFSGNSKAEITDSSTKWTYFVSFCPQSASEQPLMLLARETKGLGSCWLWEASRTTACLSLMFCIMN